MSQLIYHNLKNFGSRAPYKIAIYFVVFALVVFQLVDLNSEYDTTMGNPIVHAEKLIIPDARAFYLKGDQKITDYTQPISVCYGTIGPRIAKLGFNLFGMNNYGLRFNFVILSGIATLLLALSLLRIVPGIMGFLLVLFCVLNYKHFMLTRYAILENILTLFLICIVWLYLVQNRFFLRNINLIALLCSSLVLVKQNFPFYCFVLLGTFALTERISFKKLIKLCLWSLAGIFFFCCLQAMVLYKMGLLRLYVRNIITAFYAESGQNNQWYLQTFTPDGIFGIIPRYFEFLLCWYIKVPFINIIPSNFYNYLKAIYPFITYTMVILVSIIFLMIVFYLFQKKQFSKITLSLGLFLVLNFVLASQFYFYLIRAIPFFPITILFFASLYNDILGMISTERAKIVVKQTTLVLIIIFLIYRVFIQALYVYVSYPDIRSKGVEENSRQLDVFIPQKSTIFMQCYGLRFFWQTRHRIVSGDDTFLNNQMILDKAVEEGGKYVLLTDIHVDPISLRNGYDLKMLKEFHTEKSDSYMPYNYRLYEILRSTEIKAN